MFSFRRTLVPVSVITLAGVATDSRGQLVPAAPAIPGAAAAVPAVGPAVAAEPAPGFFGRVCLRLDACKRKLAPTALGQLLQNAKKPLSALTGGIIPGDPPKPTDKEAAAPGVGGAAAAGKKDAAEAKARVDAVKFLGTLDCRYYPDAAKALADGLRTDPSECVRYEAALALSRSCCCSEVTVKALEASVSGTDRDGNPAERSARVRMTACIALERCLACYTPPVPEPEPVKEEVKKPQGEKAVGEEKPATGDGEENKDKDKPDPDKKDDPKKETDKVVNRPMVPAPSKQLIERARQTVESFRELVAVSQPVIRSQVQPTPKTVFDLVQASAVEPPPQTQIAILAPAARPHAVAVASGVKSKTGMGDTPAAQLEPATPDRRQPSPMPRLMPTDSPTVPAAATQTVSELAPAQPVLRALPTEHVVKELSTKALTGTDAAQQHAAIRDLVRHDWKSHPLVASTLLLGAKTASFSDVVRVDFLRHLATHRINHRDVIEGLTTITMDNDPWVRDEATKALATLTTGR